MRRAKRAFLILVALFVALFVLIFVLENQQAASLVFFGWPTAELPISVIVTLALILGMFVGPMLALLVGRRNARQKG
ncbi:hypothetical protein C1Y26_11650 [Pseudomonas sp. MPR-R2A7]|nr:MULTISPECIES: lipopolysaccharide assembly protein LapA domain-containing protein [unclassified Pseudomonas]PMY13381.1 hypothetical protein C1Y22_12650 [Pseudomonas sp. MPR-R2A5]PMX25878.1 hypothetical protein C1Y23_14025 [Pseudomonas sp. GW460-12]PMX33410.1 hypothetical protein C1Y24_17660 [Pseudomonas sp. MPR-R2A4]PMX41203.1 hypothetical protein C1Y26_11650 [Pseudomonas sp. MPR-R2A7]PMX52940.1 hypothetical protein C1Y17_16445 [Pseudomonas sp. MPR-R2A6]